MYSERGAIYEEVYNVKINEVAWMVKYVQDAMETH